MWQRGFMYKAFIVPAGFAFTCITDAKTLTDTAASLPPLARPLCIDAQTRGTRTRSTAWDCHVWGKPFPAGSLYQPGIPGVLVGAPWFSFLQMSSHLNLPDAIRLGMELCGTHSTLPFSPKLTLPYTLTPREIKNGFSDCSPITSAEELKALLSQTPAGKRSKAYMASRFIADGSRSPGESRLYILLCLPVRLGGYGLPRPILNARIDLPEELQRITGAQHYRCDLYYEDPGLAIEYDGGYHWEGEQRMDDNTRQLILETLGITCIRIDKKQLENAALLDMQARRIAKHLGFRVRKPGERAMKKRIELRRQVLDWNVDLYA